MDGSLIIGVGAEMRQPEFWIALTKIIWIDILLSGDNALVIALACRELDPRQRFWGIALGAGAAIFLRVIFTGIIATLMALPYLKLVGGAALILVAAKLLVPEDKNGEGEIESASNLWAAVKIIAIADAVMSLDNVIAIAAAADGSIFLLILGLVISIPIIIGGAALIMKLLDRLPVLVWLGAALLGWIAGDVMSTDPAVYPLLVGVLDGQIMFHINAISTVFSVAKEVKLVMPIPEFICALLSTIIVLVWGYLWRQRRLRANGAIPVPSIRS